MNIHEGQEKGIKRKRTSPKMDPTIQEILAYKRHVDFKQSDDDIEPETEIIVQHMDDLVSKLQANHSTTSLFEESVDFAIKMKEKKTNASKCVQIVFDYISLLAEKNTLRYPVVLSLYFGCSVALLCFRPQEANNTFKSCARILYDLTIDTEFCSTHKLPVCERSFELVQKFLNLVTALEWADQDDYADMLTSFSLCHALMMKTLNNTNHLIALGRSILADRPENESGRKNEDSFWYGIACFELSRLYEIKGCTTAGRFFLSHSLTVLLNVLEKDVCNWELHYLYVVVHYFAAMCEKEESIKGDLVPRAYDFLAGRQDNASGMEEMQNLLAVAWLSKLLENESAKADALRTIELCTVTNFHYRSFSLILSYITSMINLGVIEEERLITHLLSSGMQATSTVCDPDKKIFYLSSLLEASDLDRFCKDFIRSFLLKFGKSVQNLIYEVDGDFDELWKSQCMRKCDIYINDCICKCGGFRFCVDRMKIVINMINQAYEGCSVELEVGRKNLMAAAHHTLSYALFKTGKFLESKEEVLQEIDILKTLPNQRVRLKCLNANLEALQKKINCIRSDETKKKLNKWRVLLTLVVLGLAQCFLWAGGW